MTEGGGPDAEDGTGPPADPDGDGATAAGPDDRRPDDATKPVEDAPAEDAPAEDAAAEDADLVDRGRGWGSDPADPRAASHERDARHHGDSGPQDPAGDPAEEGSIAGEFRPSDEIEPGDVDLEAIAFVALGAILTVLAGAHLLPGGLSLAVALVLSGVTGTLVAVLAAFLVFVGD